jgi:hypothetical protein
VIQEPWFFTLEMGQRLKGLRISAGGNDQAPMTNDQLGLEADIGA